MILLDTSVLSLVLRRRQASPVTQEVRDTLGRMVLSNTPLGVPGIVIQEVLSGVKTESQFDEVRAGLEAFPVVLAVTGDHVQAAALFNACRSRGISASVLDSLIAALAIRHGAELWTLDTDFERIARCCELKLFQS